MTETKKPKRRAIDRRPVAVHASAGIRMGARTVMTCRVGATPTQGHEMRVDGMEWHPLGVVISSGGRDLVLPAARLDWVELEG